MTLERRINRLRLKGGALPWPSFRRSIIFPPAGTVVSSPGLETVHPASCGRRSVRRSSISARRSHRTSTSWRSFDCVLHIADLHRVLSEDPGMAAPEEERDVDAVVGRVATYEEHVRFDGILGWNLFDYLDAPCRVRAREANRPQLSFRHDSAHDHVHQRHDSGQPGRITIVDPRSLRFERLSPTTRDGARHTPRSLQKLLPGFNLQHSFLLQEGMQDYVFVHE